MSIASCVRCVAALAALATAGAGTPRSLPATETPAPAPARSPWTLPAYLEENRGQAPDGWDFLARCRGYHAFLRSAEAVFSFDGCALRLALDGARPVTPDVSGREMTARVSYFLGNDPSKWISGVPLASGVTYTGVADGTTWDFGLSDRSLEFRLTVPGDADPLFVLDGARETTVDRDGSLRIEMPSGCARFTAPVAWQAGDGGTRTPVAARFVPEPGGGLRIALGRRDSARAVVIDPTVTYATYLGGSGAESLPRVAVDGNGDLCLALTTNSSNFPASGATFDLTLNTAGVGDIAAIRLSGTDGTMLQCSYLGGSGGEFARGIGVLADGTVVVSGDTTNAAYPTTAGVFAPTGSASGTQSVLSKIAADGTALVWSTYVTGMGGTSAFALGPSGNPHIASGTLVDRLSADATTRTYHVQIAATTGGGATSVSAIASTASDGLLVGGGTSQPALAASPGTYQTVLAGSTDGLIVRLDSAGAVVWRTYLGGTASDVVYGVREDAAGHVIVSGVTNSIFFPTTTDAFKPYATTNIGTYTDAFVSRLTADAKKLRYSTFIGGTGSDTVLGLAGHPSGSIVVYGETTSTDLSATGGFQTSYGGGTKDAFLVSVASDGAHRWTSYLGGTSDDSMCLNGAAVGPDGRIFASTATNSTGIATVSPVQASPAGGGDVFIEHVAGTAALSATPVLATATSLPGCTASTPFTGALAASGGTQPHRWSIITGSLPSGLSLTQNGTISGTTTQLGTYPLMVRVLDANDYVDEADVTLVVSPLPTVTPATLGELTIHRPSDLVLTPSGGSTPFTFEVTSGATAPGTTLLADGRITGTPTSTGSFVVTVKLTDGQGATASRAYSMAVNAQPSVTPATFPAWTTGQPFTPAFGGTAGTPPYAFAVLSGTPPATSLDPATGIFGGEAAVAGTYTYTIRLTDRHGAVATRTYQTEVRPVPTVATAAVPPAAVGRPYSVHVSAVDGTAPYTWDLLTSSLPEGLVLGRNDGVVSGVPVARTDLEPILGATDVALALAQRPLRFRVGEVADLAKRSSSQTVKVSPTADPTLLRAIEVTAGTVLDVTVTGGGAKFEKPVVSLFDALGNEVDLGRTLFAGYHGAKIRRFTIPATGRYFVSCEPAPFFNGKLTMKISVTPEARWTGSGTVDGAGADLLVPFAAPTGAKVTIAARHAKGSPSAPVFAAVTGPGGSDVLAGGTVKTSGTLATFQSKTALAAGDHIVRISAAPGRSGTASVTVTLRLPRTYDCAMPDLPAGDGE